MAEGSTRVLLADDHPPTRLGVRGALEDRGFVIVGEASSGVAAVELAAATQPEVCLLDVRMPGGDGVAAVRGIRAVAPDAQCVMLTAFRDDDDLFAALRAGAAGYLLKDIDPDRLPDALQGVLRGEAALPRSLVTRLVDEFRDHGGRRLTLRDGRTVQLTEREVTVLRGLGAGRSTGQLAAALGVAPVTVRTHVHALLRKLRVPDRDAAVALLQDQDPGSSASTG